MERKKGVSAAAAAHVSVGVFTYLRKSEIGMVLFCLGGLAWIVWYLLFDIGKDYDQPGPGQ